MADPTPLSPQTQAVLDAIKAVSPAPADEIAAVALRAAADETPVPVSVDGLPEQDARWYRRGVVSFRQALRVIAAELEGSHG